MNNGKSPLVTTGQLLGVLGLLAFGAGIGATGYALHQKGQQLQAEARTHYKDGLPLTDDVGLWVDPKTGCHYLVHDGSLSPRTGPDYMQLCVEGDAAIVGFHTDEQGRRIYDDGRIEEPEEELLPEAEPAPAKFLQPTPTNWRF